MIFDAGSVPAFCLLRRRVGSNEDIDGRIGRDILTRAGISDPVITATSHNVGTLLRLSLCGVGACVCPQIIVNSVLSPQQGEAIWMFPLGPEAANRIQFGYPAHSYLWSVVEEFIACAKDVVKNNVQHDRYRLF